MVKVEDVISGPRPIRACVPQESILGPAFFSLYINDLPTPQDVRLKIGIYAVDTIIYDTPKNNTLLVNLLDGALENINTCRHVWRVKINATKSEAILFPGKRTRRGTLSPPP